MPRRTDNWVVTGWKAFALAPIAIPVILILKLFGIGKDTERSAEEVAGFIRDFIDGSGGDWDWDDFVCVPIRDQRLDAIRSEASMVDLPATENDIEELRRLLVRAEALTAETGP